MTSPTICAPACPWSLIMITSLAYLLVRQYGL